MAVAVVVEENIKKGQIGAFAEYMREMIALTKQEKGCIAYDFYKSVDSEKCVMVEIWEDKESLDAHLESEHFKKFIPGGDIYKETASEIRVFERQ